jgi:transcriptional regulator with XRE-family HTH domain
MTIEKLQATRRAAGLTLNAVSRRAGMHEAHVCRVLRGTQPGTPDALRRIETAIRELEAERKAARELLARHGLADVVVA